MFLFSFSHFEKEYKLHMGAKQFFLSLLVEKEIVINIR